MRTDGKNGKACGKSDAMAHITALEYPLPTVTEGKTNCPHCGSHASYVTSSPPEEIKPNMTIKRRYRTCRDCAGHFVSIEILEPAAKATA